PISGMASDTPTYGSDYGAGSFHGNSLYDLDELHQVTFVKDFHSIGPDMQSPHHPGVFTNAVAGMHGTPQSPGHFFSKLADPYAAFPAAWPSMTAGVSGGPDVATISNVVIDVPAIDETAWDGAASFATQKGVGRSIIGLGPSSPPVPMASSNGLVTKAIVGDFTGDGRADVLVAYSGYSFTPFHQATGAGQFSITTPVEPYNWINLPGVTSLVGDFDGDHHSDVLMFRAGWQSTPIYF